MGVRLMSTLWLPRVCGARRRRGLSTVRPSDHGRGRPPHRRHVDRQIGSDPMDHRLQEIADRADATFDEVLEFLDSPAGRRLRWVLATSLIISVPLVVRIPGLRASPIGRLLTVTGGATM